MACTGAILAAVHDSDTERVVRAVWEAFERDGIAGVLACAVPDAHWHPHSAHGRRFDSTEDYARFLEQQSGGGERVEAQLLGVWVHGDVGVTRGRMRMRRRGSVEEDTRMYWAFRIRGERVTWMASSPDLGGIMRAVGLPDRSSDAMMALHREAT
jgi:hypothetical protein